VSVFIKGVLAVILVMGALFGMVYLLLSMVLGSKLAYWVEGCVTFGVLSIMSLIWFISALGPTGADTAWQAIALGPNLTEAKAFGTTYNVADYPGDGWQKPKVGARLADLKGADDTDAEATQAKPVLDSAVGDAVSSIPGQVDLVKPIVQGDIGLTTGEFTNYDILLKAVKVQGKDSLIAVAKGAPSKSVNADLGPGVTDGTLNKYLLNIGDKVDKGQDFMSVTTKGGNVNVKSSDPGIIAAEPLRPGDRVRAGGPVMTVDLSGQPDQPPAIIVVAVRVRGRLRTPAMYYLVVSLLLLAIHMLGLRSYERKRRALRESLTV
jgi:branched-subunit amino acid transport protein